jgi:hypothetical protein
MHLSLPTKLKLLDEARPASATLSSSAARTAGTAMSEATIFTMRPTARMAMAARAATPINRNNFERRGNADPFPPAGASVDDSLIAVQHRLSKMTPRPEWSS